MSLNELPPPGFCTRFSLGLKSFHVRLYDSLPYLLGLFSNSLSQWSLNFNPSPFPSAPHHTLSLLNFFCIPYFHVTHNMSYLLLVAGYKLNISRVFRLLCPLLYTWHLEQCPVCANIQAIPEYQTFKFTTIHTHFSPNALVCMYELAFLSPPMENRFGMGRSGGTLTHYFNKALRCSTKHITYLFNSALALKKGSDRKLNTMLCKAFHFQDRCQSRNRTAGHQRKSQKCCTERGVTSIDYE